MYIYFILIGVAVLIAISIVFLTIFVVKNVMRKIENGEEIPSIDPNAQWGGIRDFSDINSSKEGKVYSFKKDEFDTEVSTVGADISDFINENNKKIDINDNREKSLSEQPIKLADSNIVETTDNSKDNSNNNVDYDATRSLQEIDYDATRSLDDIDYDATRSLEDVYLHTEQEKKIKVTLKYKDTNGLKIQKMDTSQITVGRGIGNDLLFRSDSFTSRNHAIFNIKNNELYLKDLNSKNGTYINKTTKVEGEVKLEESCEITFGDVIVEVIIEK